ncbi:MAG TPA: hypothetical protein DHV49_00635 [Alphaproteobacteria bacterium]|nr:hypothetical protein [Alphaproteobacteria bacterium]
MKSLQYARRANADLKDMTDYTARIWGTQQAKNTWHVAKRARGSHKKAAQPLAPRNIRNVTQ